MPSTDAPDAVMSYFGAVAELRCAARCHIYNYRPHRIHHFAQRGALNSPAVINIVGIKDTIPDITHAWSLSRPSKTLIPSFEVFGFDHNFCPTFWPWQRWLHVRCFNVRLPDLCVAWRDAMKARDFDGTAEYQQLFNRIVGVYGFSSPFMAAMKRACLWIRAFLPQPVYASPIGRQLPSVCRAGIHARLWERLDVKYPDEAVRVVVTADAVTVSGAAGMQRAASLWPPAEITLLRHKSMLCPLQIFTPIRRMMCIM